MEETSDTSIKTERDKIRANLSQMSFEEIMKLKDKMGATVYNETVFGESSKKRNRPTETDYKRVNKNRPREMSAKRPKRNQQETIIPVKKSVSRDPRYDPLCGTFNEHEFKKSYKFINNIKSKERTMLKEELQDTEDPKRKNKIKYLIQRLDNQLREKEKRDKEHEKVTEEKKEFKEQLKKGDKPEYQKKSEKKILNLLNKYEELKQKKQLVKHIEKKSKKAAGKDFKRMKEVFE